MQARAIVIDNFERNIDVDVAIDDPFAVEVGPREIERWDGMIDGKAASSRHRTVIDGPIVLQRGTTRLRAVEVEIGSVRVEIFTTFVDRISESRAGIVADV